MSRTVRLGLGVVLAASICLFGGATTGTAAESMRDPVVRAFVEYGDPPVSLAPGQRARVSFQGRRGDIVRLSGAVGPYTLRSAGREVRETWPGYYRLRADRRYTFSIRPSTTDPDYTQRLLLEKLAVRPLARDGRAVTFGTKRRGFVPAVSFNLKPHERTMITTPGYGSKVFTADGEQVVYGDPILEVGQRLASARGDWYHDPLPLRAGEVIILAGRKGTVRAIGSEIVPVALDGALAAVRSRQTEREVALRFPAAAGQLVHLSGVPTTTRVSPTMYGPTQAITRAPTGFVWRVSEGGIQTISLFPSADTHFDAGAAVVTRIGSMTADGPALTFSPPEPGRWVYADVDGGYIPTLTATASTFAAGAPWSASVTEPSAHNCLMPYGPNGCGEQGAATVTDTTPRASSIFPLPPSSGSFVFLRVPPGTGGSVDLQVTKWAPPPT